MARDADPTTYQTTQPGVQVVVRAVPTNLSEAGEELGFSLGVMRNLDALIAQALDAAPETSTLELDYAEVVVAPDPVSLELRRVSGA